MVGTGKALKNVVVTFLLQSLSTLLNTIEQMEGNSLQHCMFFDNKEGNIESFLA